ncbi:hypothetical protein O181_032205 [Austropuccinia psidii MF-1]|uniref:Uncharacterized protein n=1 Tax=Austropuccinia psidii MF-1 TaxID=1389203 RepID=A0A9Q3H801_9BASI|nr:hypothetical protein [Austropuccinia psidii MF-1]
MRTLQLVALTQSMEEPFGKYFSFFPVPNFPSPLLQPSPACLATPASVILIDNMPIGSPPPFLCQFLAQRSLPAPSSPHSHDEAHQEFTDLWPTIMILGAIVYD